MKTSTLSRALVLGAASVPALTAVSCDKTPERKPNVIFILMDDAGYGDFGCYGQTRIETPNIDSLAARGIRFTDMDSAAPLSSPARCGLLTGMHTGHAQIRANDEMTARGDVWNHEAMLRDSTLEGQAPLKAGTPTLGSVMRQGGYRTAMIGKWGVGGPATESTPNKMGFDEYFGCICQRQAHCYYPPFLWENDRRIYLDNELLPPGTPLDEGADPLDPHSYDKYTQQTYSPDIMYDRVLRFVNENRERPFFLMWTTPIPHSPMQAPDEMVQYYVEKFGDEAPIEGKGYFPSRWPHATYAAMITYFDRQVGGLVAELKRLGIWDDTIIVVTSDNGPASNSCSSTEWFQSAHPFRSGKGWGKSSLREGGIRMPFIVAWGDRIDRPHVNGHVGYFPDVMPTLCDIAGVETPQPTASRCGPRSAARSAASRNTTTSTGNSPAARDGSPCAGATGKGCCARSRREIRSSNSTTCGTTCWKSTTWRPTTPTWWPGCGNSSAPRIPSRKIRFSKWRSPKSDRQADRMRRLRLRREGPDGRIAPPKGGATNRR